MGRWITLVTFLFSFSALAALPPLDLLYYEKGIRNTDTSFDISAIVGDATIAKAANALYAVVEYAELSKANELNIMPRQQIGIGQMPVVKYPYINVKVDRLKPTTMYRARITVYRKEANGGFTALHTTPFYYTTTTGPDDKSIIRTAMVLKGLKEFSDSEKGYVGLNGTKFKDGTKYGADLGEKWCSEFYAWLAAPSLKGAAGLASVKKLTNYFTTHKGMEPASAIPEKARRGDYLSMDGDNSGAANHSGMFLAFDKDDEGDFVWTLEGNYGNQIKVNRRPFNKVFKGLGRIMHSQFK